jgi:hypothetical protein
MGEDIRTSARAYPETVLLEFFKEGVQWVDSTHFNEYTKFANKRGTTYIEGGAHPLHPPLYLPLLWYPGCIHIC